MDQQANSSDELVFNLQDYWGPNKNFLFESYSDLPFAPYSRLDKFAKYCDFQSSKQGIAARTAGNMQNEDEKEFIQVENYNPMKNNKSKLGYRPKVYNRYNADQHKGPYNRGYQPYQRNRNIIKTKFYESINVKQSWEMQIESNKAAIEKVKIQKVNYYTLYETGLLKEFNQKLDTKKEKKLEHSNKFPQIPLEVSKDPYLTDLINRDAEQGVNRITVYTTDGLLTTLMTMKNSEFPWDLEIHKDGKQIIIDKCQNEKQGYIDMQTVNENTQNILPEDEKEVNKLCQEATQIAKSFQMHALNLQGHTQKTEQSNQLPGFENLPTMFKYVKCSVDDFDVIVRVSVDCLIKREDGQNFSYKHCLLRTINEYNLETEWRKKLEKQAGALISQELLNNSCNVLKWLCQMHISSTDFIKIGLISRESAKDTVNHNILQVDTFSRQELQKNISFKINEYWSVVKYLIQYLYPNLTDEKNQEKMDGTYVIIKQSFKPNIKIYLVPEEKEEVDEERGDNKFELQN